MLSIPEAGIQALASYPSSPSLPTTVGPHVLPALPWGLSSITRSQLRSPFLPSGSRLPSPPGPHAKAHTGLRSDHVPPGSKASREPLLPRGENPASPGAFKGHHGLTRHISLTSSLLQRSHPAYSPLHTFGSSSCQEYPPCHLLVLKALVSTLPGPARMPPSPGSPQPEDAPC